MARTRLGVRITARTAAILFVAAGPLGAQTDDLARVRAEFGEAPAARIGAAVDDGVRDGLPRGLLVDKALEGVAKGMAPDVVLQAVIAFADELRAAAAVVGPGADPETLERAASALRRGVDRGLIAELDRESPETFAIMVIALEDLLDLSVPLAAAESMVRDAASRGLTSDEVLELSANVKRLVRDGRTPGQAASSVHAGMRRGGGVGPPHPADGPPRLRLRGRRDPPIG